MIQAYFREEFAILQEFERNQAGEVICCMPDLNLRLLCFDTQFECAAWSSMSAAHWLMLFPLTSAA